MHEVSAGKPRCLVSTRKSSTRHINFFVGDVVTQASVSRQLSTRVGISSAYSNTTIFKKIVKKYSYILDVQFQDLLEKLETVALSPNRKFKFKLSKPQYNIKYGAVKLDFFCVFTRCDIDEMPNLTYLKLHPVARVQVLCPYRPNLGCMNILCK